MSRFFDWRYCAVLLSAVFIIACPHEGDLAETPEIPITDGALSTGVEETTVHENSNGGPIATATSDDASDSTQDSLGSSTTDSGTSTTGTTEAVDGECGNDVLDPGEECDEGTDNHNEGACTAACTKAVCGDGHTWEDGGEECDDGDNNEDGAYGKCSTSCVWGPRCGDDKVQLESGEICDGNDDNGDEYDGPPCAPACRFDAKFVFVSSVYHDGSFGDLEAMDGLEKADAFCTELGQSIVEGLTDAEGNPLQIEFRAWLSSSDSSVNERFVKYEDKAYVRRDGVELAPNWSKFTDGAIAAPITKSENNDTVSSVQIWTNTDPHGDRASFNTHCMDWTANAIGNEGLFGINTEGSNFDGTWTYIPENQGGKTSCSLEARLYCVEQ